MGLFFYTKKGSIISTVDLPTTEIIEPFSPDCLYSQGAFVFPSPAYLKYGIIFLIVF
jgi:hypothetical protein